ncbi:MAG: hypothetical protein R3B09_09935 [Nannocystaceae bacterium]
MPAPIRPSYPTLSPSTAAWLLGGAFALAACTPGGDVTTGATEATESESATGTTETTDTSGEPETTTSTSDTSTTDTSTTEDPSTSTTASTTDTATTEDPSTSTGAPTCVDVSECQGGPCRSAVECLDGLCVFDDLPEGTVLEAQSPGDCAIAVCDGEGGITSEAAPDDLPDDGIACTIDACDGVDPVHTLAVTSCYTGPKETLEVGVCVAGVRTCDVDLGDFGPCEDEVTPALELCSGKPLDEDCDGVIDEGCVCGDGELGEGEECDDGNAIEADKCSPKCQRTEVLELARRGTTCARLGGGRVKCWGTNAHGALGLGDTESRGDQPGEMGANLPFVDLGDVVVTKVVSGVGDYAHVCALVDDGRIKCWGSAGGLGLGDAGHHGDEPGEMGDALPFVDLGKGVLAKDLSAGADFTCALTTAGRVKCWGDPNTIPESSAGQLGLGDEESYGNVFNQMGDNLPYVDLGKGVIAVALATGDRHTCALLDDGKVKCWGYNGYGQLGLGDSKSRGKHPGEMGDSLPYVDLGGDAVAISAGLDSSCALLADNTLKCWGDNFYGQLGLGDQASRGDQPGEMGASLPGVDVGGAVLAVSLAGSSACALLKENHVKCWGRNSTGALGLGDAANRGDQPGEMGASLPSLDLGAGVAVTSLGSSCAVFDDGSAKCWGRNNAGELGLGDTANRGDQPGEMGDALPRIRLFSDAW